MTSPLIHEPSIKQVLEPSAPASGTQLQAAVLYLLLDAYDRKVTREFFAELLGEAIDLYAGIITLRFGVKIEVLLRAENPDISPEKLVSAMREHCLCIKAVRTSLDEKLSKMMECANTGVPIS